MGTGQASRSPDLAELIRNAIDYRLAEVHTSIPGRVEKINASNQTVDVKPLIKRQLAYPDGSEITESLPIIPRVPLQYPRAGRFFITWPIKAGDLVELVFTEASRDNFKAGSGNEVEPDDFRRFDLSDAYAMPGAYPESKAIRNFDADNLRLGVDGGATIVIKEDGNVSVIPSGAGFGHIGAENGAEPIALGNKTDTRFNALENAVINMASTINANVAVANSIPLHAAYPQTPVVPPLPGSSVGSTKSKAT